VSRKLVVLIAVVLAGCPFRSRQRRKPTAVAGTFHVAVTGDDDDEGSEKKPWRTLQRAAETVTDGDTVVVHPGTYGGFEIVDGGGEERPITFRGLKGARIHGGNSRTGDGINIEGAPWIVVEGFEIYGTGRAGVRVQESEHVTVRDNDCHDNFRWGIFTAFSEDVVIEGNDTSGSEDEHGIYVSNSADNPIIRRNRVYENSASGIQINADIEMGGDGIITGAVVEGNKVWANGKAGGAAINLDGVHGAIVQNNILYNNHASGIALYRINGKLASRKNRVLHNTIIQAKDGRWAIVQFDEATGNEFYGNILWHLGPKGSFNVTADSLPAASNHNVVMDRFTADDEKTRLDLAAWREKGFDEDSLVAAPAKLFEDKIDFHLRDESPAIDAGDPANAPKFDLDGHPRMDGKPDIGAYER
jgi:parallel beta-helix repeat protein